MMSESVSHSQNQYGNSIMVGASVRASRRTKSSVSQGELLLLHVLLIIKARAGILVQVENEV